MLINILNSIGVPSIKIKGWEGDDLMVLLQRLSKESIMMTDDKDLIQVLDDHTDVIRPMQKQHLTLNSYLESQGMEDIREMVIIKAIVGDGSDNIPSVTEGCERAECLGAVRAKTVAKIILECNEDPEKYLPILINADKNYYKGFIRNHENYLRNMKLVDLSLVPNDPQILDTLVTEVIRRAGKCNFLDASQLLAEQEITSFDLNGFISKMSIVSCSIRA
jgi:5'-3' exonuclease